MDWRFDELMDGWLEGWRDGRLEGMTIWHDHQRDHLTVRRHDQMAI